MAQDDPIVCQSRSFGIVQRSGNRHRSFAVGSSPYDDPKAVGEAVSDVERLRKSRIVPDRDGIDYL